MFISTKYGNMVANKRQKGFCIVQMDAIGHLSTSVYCALKQLRLKGHQEI